MADAIEKCRRCKRPKAADITQWDANKDGAVCGSHLPEYGATKRELYGDCQGHLAHVLGIQLVRATSLLDTASMSHFMDPDYQREFSERVRAFLVSPELKELIS